nr:hypothetical protein [Marinicella sp. W31]MDC2876636.1 hypothetical protein [Marinicella sp. W31]
MISSTAVFSDLGCEQAEHQNHEDHKLDGARPDKGENSKTNDKADQFVAKRLFLQQAQKAVPGIASRRQKMAKTLFFSTGGSVISSPARTCSNRSNLPPPCNIGATSL